MAVTVHRRNMVDTHHLPLQKHALVKQTSPTDFLLHLLSPLSIYLSHPSLLWGLLLLVQYGVHRGCEVSISPHFSTVFDCLDCIFAYFSV